VLASIEVVTRGWVAPRECLGVDEYRNTNSGEIPDQFKQSKPKTGDEMQTTKPSKEAVRHWMNRDRKKDPVKQTLEEIRRQLGWKLIKGR